MIPEAVAAAWGWPATAIEAVAGGLINQTYAVTREGARVAVVQRLHAVFGAAVNLDLEAITAHLAARGMITPRLVRTLGGTAWFEDAGHVWRALTYVGGITVDHVPAPAWAAAAGELVGTFHRAVADLEHTYAFARAGVHDTAAHLARLAQLAAGAAPGDDRELAREILDAAQDLPILEVTPRRHCHGDLKISNVRFASLPGGGPLAAHAPHAPRAKALVDLDTLGHGTLAFELGDAMRSWCNPAGEDAGSVRFELPIFAAAIGGFRRRADSITTLAERRSIVDGLEIVCIELAARFAVDVFRDEYFGWDASRFPSRRAHNAVRARGQLALGRAVHAARADALAIVLVG